MIAVKKRIGAAVLFNFRKSLIAGKLTKRRFLAQIPLFCSALNYLLHMKKLLLILLVVLALFTSSLYLFIPGKIIIDSSVAVKTTDVGTERFLIDETKWPLWWNKGYSGDHQTGPVFTHNGYSFQQTGRFYKSVDIAIGKEQRRLLSKLMIIPLAVDSTSLQWKAEFITSRNPITRIADYLEAKQIKKSMNEILGGLKNFLSYTYNIYGIQIERNRLRDTLYVSSKKMLPKNPTVKEIYQLIDQIKGYIKQNGIEPSGSPIYNATRMDEGRYQLMAAVPVNKHLPETAGFSMKYMVKGSFMISEVAGGDSAIQQASKNMQQYFQDYRKTSMAMNFTMLVTDRILQPDSSKWVTKLCMPVY